MKRYVGPLLLLVFGTCVTAEYALEGEQYSLECTSAQEVQYWMLNGIGVALQVGETYEKQKIRVFQNGTILFMDVKVTHEGDHLCVTKHAEILEGHPVPMQVRPKLSKDPWNDIYKAQFITGLLSALFCAFLFTAGCLVFKYRYREPNPGLLIPEEGGHYNPALEVDVDAKGENTKM